MRPDLGLTGTDLAVCMLVLPDAQALASVRTGIRAGVRPREHGGIQRPRGGRASPSLTRTCRPPAHWAGVTLT